MIETRKILQASYDNTVTPNISLSTQTFTIGNSLKNSQSMFKKILFL